LLFHPYLAGERAPLWNADLRGSFFGLALHHRRAHLIRAALEGVIFNLLGILPAVEAVTGPAEHIVATGGFAHSALWRQIMADIFGREVVVPASIESSCFGAAVLGLHALRMTASLAEGAAMIGAIHRHRPIPENAAVYARLRPIFMAIPRKLEQEYQLLAQFQMGNT
jgi:gluconokinase